MDDHASYEAAKERVQELKGFYLHLTVYVLVNALLILINFVSSPGVWWFYWPLFGWGIGVAAHAVSVFGFGGFLGKEWEEKKIREFLEKGKRP